MHIVFPTLLLSLLLAINPPPQGRTSEKQEAPAPIPGWSANDQERFYAQLKDGLAKSQEKFNSFWSNFSKNNTTISPAYPLEARAYENTVEVKSTLFNNFYGAASLEDPGVRDVLLKIFNKEFVNMNDLVELQDAVGRAQRK